MIVLAALVALVAPFGLVAHASPDARPAVRPQISFAGNHQLPSEALAGVVRTALRDREPPYDRDVLDRAALELSKYYWDRGYADAKIAPPRLDPTGALSFAIHEGAVFTLSSVEVRGVAAAEAAADRALLHERAGTRFSRRDVGADDGVLRDRYGDAGHAFASIEPRSKEDEAHHTIALAFWIDAGPRVRVGWIHVYPHGRTTAEAMRRVLTVAPGQWYRASALLESKRRIQALGLGEVAVSTEHGASPALVDVSFELAVGP